MDEVSAEAKLASEGAAQPLVVAVPRAEVQRAIDEEQEADLMLDVVRTNGQREERRVVLGLDAETLSQLIADQQGEQILVAVDPESLAASFDDVEAHGLREIGATFAIAIAAVGGGAGLAGAAVDQGTGAQGDPPTFQAFATDFPVVQASVPEAGMPRAMPADYAAAEQQMPRAMPSDYAAAAAADDSVQLRRDPGAVSNIPATNEPAAPGGISERATEPAVVPTDASSAIENVRLGIPAEPDPSSVIENVRVAPATEAGDGGTTISAPSVGAAVAIAGGAMLTIAAAAFALRRRREPRPA
jgi:hypothetical protein